MCIRVVLGVKRKNARVTLTLNEGDMVLFRGDLAHAGAKYEDENICLHCYVRVRGIRYRSNTTETVPFKSYGCSKCMSLCDSRQGLRDHKLVCNFEADFPCLYCDSSFNKPYTLTKHISRKQPGEHRARRSSRHADEAMEEATESDIHGEDGDDEGESEDDEEESEGDDGESEDEEEDEDKEEKEAEEEESESDLSEPGESS
ncbi:hypothetical protein PHYSODRAFT_293099 [Phytophthora sojae]|uniref:C2H2-type domain-containing protein n=1 Tax=Phytophthora sojae (strain P6497) TaxID=1094619 RepID=G4YFJ1_PHYSP|nr:hypothetical protein PHYSODRAFT_293099 [Phytophthora sojae]EGZ26976.1 hypothetical protein PHYSODRAFT_293099 [Phytophthora sojae]|eukprot:XP_009514251.1 hypothetical protein PHYSODRAFT_293099 [Phytophthora sojae]